MPMLKPGERTQRCLAVFHAAHRIQKYYVVRKYFNNLENKICPGCLHVMLTMGLVNYSIDNGYEPIGRNTEQSILSSWTEQPKKVVKNGR